MKQSSFNLVLTAFIAVLVSVVMVVIFYLVLFFPPRGVFVPGVVGMTARQAEPFLAQRGLAVAVGDSVDSETVALGLIARQEPMPGLVTRRGTKIQVFLSRGAQHAAVPDLTGLSLEHARLELASVGMEVGSVDTVAAEKLAVGLVVRSSPPPGTVTKRGARVFLFLSQGREGILVPDLVGRRLAFAQRLLAARGLETGEVRRVVSTEYPVGTVLAQAPKPGTTLTNSRRVDLVIATALP